MCDSHRVDKMPINDVLAENLAYWMEQAGVDSQSELSRMTGIAQTTISNYLHPKQRAPSATGKVPSAKIAELDKIADALHIQTWQLLRRMTPSERKMYAHIEAAYLDLVNRLQDEPPTPLLISDK